MSDKKPIYTMLSTGGSYHKNKSNTPTGTYYIQHERGNNFYNYKLNEGAEYYVSWKDHGIYLFHSVPTKPDGTVSEKEAKKLGKSPGSHGCIRLSIPDSKWLATTVPVGTKVVIKNN
ncbi:L,D-transpeptidase [Lactobacillus taiwanensis]